MGLLERDRFLAQLGDVLGGTRQGPGRLVLVCGEAGVGKTALVEAFAAGLGDGDRVVWGACDAVTPGRPFGPLVDIAQQAQGQGPQAEAAGELREALRDGDRDRAFDAFLGLLRGADAPRVVVFEDVQWADAATLDLLRVVGRRLRTIGALVVATCRDDEVGAAHPLRLALGDLPAPVITRLELTNLTAAAVETLVAGTGLDAEALHAATGGNPFFVTEVVATGADVVPATVRDAVWARASRLSPAGLDVLRAASVLGGRCEPALLQAVSGVGGAAVDECIERGMLVAGGDVHVPGNGNGSGSGHGHGFGFGFRHELARRAVVDGLPAGERVGLHRRALAVLRSRVTEADPARLAHHAVEAGDGDAVVELGPAAARRAAALGAHREAAAHYATTLRFADRLDDAARAGLLEHLSRELYLTAEVTAAIEALDEALACWRRRGDGLREGACTSSLAYLRWCSGAGARAQDLAARAVELLESTGPGTPELARAYGVKAQLLMVSGHDHPTALVIGRKALELAEQLDEEQIVVHALNTVGTSEVCLDDDRGWARLEESLRRARRAGFQDDVGRALVNLVAEARHTRRYELAERHYADALRYTTDHDLDLDRQYVLAYGAELALEQGRWQEAAEIAAAVVERGREDAATARIQMLTVLGRLRARRGDPDPWSLLDDALDLAGVQGDLLVVCPLHAVRAETAWLAGDVDKAATEAHAGLAVVAQHASRWWRGELALWAWKATGVDDRPENCAEPYALQLDGEFLAAAAAWAALGCPYQQALALADSDDEADLQEALALLQTLGARPAAALVTARMRALGVRRIPRGPRPVTRTNPAGLTARQLEVLALMADGLRNGEIAERLVVSPKTVDHHVSTVLTKLGVPNRQAAAQQAARLGLLVDGAGAPTRADAAPAPEPEPGAEVLRSRRY